MKLHNLPKKEIVSYRYEKNRKRLDLAVPQIMGILNVTPDSFSDGGRFNSIDAALQHCEQMLKEGASIIDIGGESTRPNAAAVAEEEECQRVVPIVKAIRQRFGNDIWLSIDTSSPLVIDKSVEAGADIWNDVRALKRDGALAMAAKLQIPVILMHMRGEPDTMSKEAYYDDIISDIISELTSRINLAIQNGINSRNIIIDPGFGFAKKYQHHITLLNKLSELHGLQYPILFGVSRKRFLGEVLDSIGNEGIIHRAATDRDAIGMAAALLAVQQGVSIIRTHNVALTAAGLALWQQIQV